MAKRNYNKIAYTYAENLISGKQAAGKLTRLAAERHFRDLETAKDRGLYFDHDAGQEVIDFIEKLHHWKGAKAGTPLLLEPHQQFYIYTLFGWKKEGGLRRFSKSYKEIARKNGKALWVGTPIPTLDGWKTMGEIQVGDTVFDENGKPALVTFATDVMHNHKCYEVHFSDGTHIIADTEHLWYTETRRSGRSHGDVVKGKPRAGWAKLYEEKIKTTEQIRQTLLVDKPSNVAMGKVEYNHSIPLCAPVEYATRELPIDPYWLGLWLGDGNADSPTISVGYNEVELFDHFDKVGYAYKVYDRKTCKKVAFVNDKQRGPSCLGALIKSMGMFKNKHIPWQYLTGSVEQRRELLRGLMDTDGYVSKAGQCSFTSKSERLTLDVAELIASLGYKPTVIGKESKIHGEVKGYAYTVQFWAYQPDQIFYLSRKQVRLKQRPRKPTRASNRKITAIIEHPSVPVKCITVDSRSHLYLAGRGYIPTHNTTECAGKSLYAAYLDGEQGAQVYFVATKEDQAKIGFKDAVKIVKKTPFLRNETIFKCWQKSIECFPTDSFLKPVGSDSDTQDGFDPSYVIIDEYHAHPTDGMLNVMESGTGARLQPMIDIITTAGFNQEYPCYEFRQVVIDVLEGRAEDDGLYGLIFSLDKEDDWNDPDVWHKPNPNWNVSVYQHRLQQLYIQAKNQKGEKERDFKTKNLNIWTDAAECWIDDAVWDLGKEPLRYSDYYGGNLIAVGALDLGLTDDFSAYVVRIQLPDGRIVLDPYFWIPEDTIQKRIDMGLSQIRTWVERGLVRVTEGNVTDFKQIANDIVEINKPYNMVRVVFDRNLHQTNPVALDIQAAGFDTYGFNQGDTNYTPCVNEFERKALHGLILHNNNPVMRWMLRNTNILSRQNNNRRPDKRENRKYGKKIDGIVAALMAEGAYMDYVANPTVANVYDDRGFLD